MQERLVNMVKYGWMQLRKLDLILEQKRTLGGQTGKIQIKSVV